MSEILVKYDEPITSGRGERYFAQAVGKEVAGGLWEGWLEFVSDTDGVGTIASGRETTQPNRTDVEYWAQGLTKVYLQGALSRAISLGSVSEQSEASISESPRLNEPPRRNVSTPQAREIAPRAILDPFLVYAQGEEILRRELRALSRDHIESISAAYRVGGASSAAGVRSGTVNDLIDSIVSDVRAAVRAPASASGDTRAAPAT